jgi:hypothetical protein
MRRPCRRDRRVALDHALSVEEIVVASEAEAWDTPAALEVGDRQVLVLQDARALSITIRRVHVADRGEQHRRCREPLLTIDDRVALRRAIAREDDGAQEILRSLPREGAPEVVPEIGHRPFAP